MIAVNAYALSFSMTMCRLKSVAALVDVSSAACGWRARLDLKRQKSTCTQIIFVCVSRILFSRVRLHAFLKKQYPSESSTFVERKVAAHRK